MANCRCGLMDGKQGTVRVWSTNHVDWEATKRASCGTDDRLVIVHDGHMEVYLGSLRKLRLLIDEVIDECEMCSTDKVLAYA